MRLILTGIVSSEQQLRNAWSDRGLFIDCIATQDLLGYLANNRRLVCDILLVSWYDGPIYTPTDAIAHGINQQFQEIVRSIRTLNDSVAMADGRKWKGIPIAFLCVHDSNGVRLGIDESEGLSIPSGLTTFLLEPQEALEKVRGIVQNYKQNLLSELDNIGILVTYENGRFRVGPALANAETNLYHGLSDTRAKCITFDRDNLGINYEIELFEDLINRHDLGEHDLQIFFEEHPHFLPMLNTQQALPHVRLGNGNQGPVLIPDFILKPIVNIHRDINWEVFDLKMPTAKLISGHKQHPKLSSSVQQAISQLRNYGKFFNNPNNRNEVISKLGYALRFPKLGVLIGRLPNSEHEQDLLNDLQNDQKEVRLVTYDEILETQKSQLIQ